jgi:hypothetical protein
MRKLLEEDSLPYIALGAIIGCAIGRTAETTGPSVQKNKNSKRTRENSKRKIFPGQKFSALFGSPDFGEVI